MASVDLQKVVGRLGERPLGTGNPTLEETPVGIEARAFPVADAGPVEDEIEGLKFIQSNGSVGAGVAGATSVPGESVGAGLTITTLLTAGDQGVDQPDAGIVISAWTELAITSETIQKGAGIEAPITDDPMARRAAAQCLTADEDSMASPLCAGLPPPLEDGDAAVLQSDTTSVADKSPSALLDMADEVCD